MTVHRTARYIVAGALLASLACARNTSNNPDETATAQRDTMATMDSTRIHADSTNVTTPAQPTQPSQIDTTGTTGGAGAMDTTKYWTPSDSTRSQSP
jgi:hypothetical protein